MEQITTFIRKTLWFILSAIGMVIGVIGLTLLMIIIYVSFAFFMAAGELEVHPKELEEEDLED